MPRAELKGKIRVLTQGKLTDGVVGKMAMTFGALSQKADWAVTPATPPPPPPDGGDDGDGADVGDSGEGEDGPQQVGLSLGGLVYNIQIQLPESRDQAVYDALFKSLKAHLIQ